MEQARLSEAVLVYCTDVCVFLERLWGKTLLEFGIGRCGKGFLKCSLILFANVNHMLHHLSHRLIFFSLDVAETPFRYLSA